jgi:hypothetical protein
MIDAPGTPGNSGNPAEGDFENRLASFARTLSYPSSPDVRMGVARRLAQRPRGGRRRLALAIALIFVVVVLFAVPPVRAAILNWIQIGADRIFLVAPTQTPTPTIPPGQTITPRPTSLPSPTPLTSILDLAGETTLSQAQAQAFPPLLPAFPPDLGKPDHVYLQDFGGPVVILVWMDKTQPVSVRLAISETNISGDLFQKIVAPTVENTTVNGQPAIWVNAPYMLISGNGSYEMNRLITTGHTLIWSDGQMTFRLETGEDLATAIKIAESLQ